MTTPSSRTLPDLQGPHAPHWRGAREGLVMVQVCAACQRPRFPCANLCPHCTSPEASWQAIRPTGRVRSWCRFHRAYFPEFAGKLPYTVLLVRMDDGVDLFANFAGAALGDVPVIGQAVTTVMEEVAEGVSLVRFRAVRDLAPQVEVQA